MPRSCHRADRACCRTDKAAAVPIGACDRERRVPAARTARRAVNRDGPGNGSAAGGVPERVGSSPRGSPARSGVPTRTSVTCSTSPSCSTSDVRRPRRTSPRSWATTSSRPGWRSSPVPPGPRMCSAPWCQGSPRRPAGGGPAWPARCCCTAARSTGPRRRQPARSPGTRRDGSTFRRPCRTACPTCPVRGTAPATPGRRHGDPARPPASCTSPPPPCCSRCRPASTRPCDRCGTDRGDCSIRRWRPRSAPTCSRTCRIWIPTRRFWTRSRIRSGSRATPISTRSHGRSATSSTSRARGWPATRARWPISPPPRRSSSAESTPGRCGSPATCTTSAVWGCRAGSWSKPGPLTMTGAGPGPTAPVLHRADPRAGPGPRGLGGTGGSAP